LAHHLHWLPAGAVVDAEGADVATYMHCTCPCSKPEQMNNPPHEETMMQPPIYNVKWKSFQQTVGGYHKKFMDEV
jgi:hypothetical protein